MKLWKKFTKHFGITSVVFGAGLLTLSSALVGVGTSQSAFLTQDAKTTDNKEYTIKYKIGVGTQSYGDISYYVLEKSSGDMVKDKDVPTDIKTIAETAVQVFKGMEKDKSLSEAINSLKEERNKLQAPGSEYDTAKQALNAAQAAVDNPSPSSDAATLHGALWKAEQDFALAETPINYINTIISVKDSANSMMLSGAILLPIFAILLGLGIAITVIRVKEQKTTKAE